jgi:hypothetical protein
MALPAPLMAMIPPLRIARFLAIDDDALEPIAVPSNPP